MCLTVDNKSITMHPGQGMMSYFSLSGHNLLFCTIKTVMFPTFWKDQLTKPCFESHISYLFGKSSRCSVSSSVLMSCSPRTSFWITSLQHYRNKKNVLLQEKTCSIGNVSPTVEHVLCNASPTVEDVLCNSSPTVGLVLCNASPTVQQCYVQ